MNRHKAILLVGPTGSGKTPLGNNCETKGLWGIKCFHFDFGEALRNIAQAGNRPSLLTNGDIDIIIHSLETGVLLENENFHIAKNILLSFAIEKEVKNDDIILLNGMPRHIGQAKDIDEIVDIRMILYLECSSQVVCDRIRLNSGGDRSGRVDDSSDAIENKLMIFQDRTFPLINYYRNKNILIEKVNGEVNMSADEIHHLLNNDKKTKLGEYIENQENRL